MEQLYDGTWMNPTLKISCNSIPSLNLFKMEEPELSDTLTGIKVFQIIQELTQTLIVLT